MLMELVIIALIVVIVVILIASIQRKLSTLDENVRNAMNQIGVQMSSRFDVFQSLLELTNEYEPCNIYIEKIKSQCEFINADSTPDDIRNQEAVLSDIFVYITSVAEKYEQLKSDDNYIKFLSGAESYERMVRTSCFIYNDSATKLNSELRMFPVSLVGKIFGFEQRKLF